MSRPTIVVAARAALDVAAARRLADYDTLDEAGITRAVEQVHTQRWGRWDLPAHLAALTSIAAVVVDKGQVSEYELSRESFADETEMLEHLFAGMPAGSADVIDWDGHDVDTLIARCVAADIRLPAAIARGHRRCLARWIAPTPYDHPAPDRAFEDECSAIFIDAGDNASATPLAGRARVRTRLWWRIQHTRRAMSDVRRRALITQLDALERP